MNGNEYENLAMRTNDGMAKDRLIEAVYENDCVDVGSILNASLGLSGEVGEFNDMIKKWIFHENDIDIDHMKKELGDIMWYVAMMCHSFGWNLDNILQINIDKLKARYPDGFDIVRANNRKDGDV